MVRATGKIEVKMADSRKSKKKPSRSQKKFVKDLLFSIFVLIIALASYYIGKNGLPDTDSSSSSVTVEKSEAQEKADTTVEFIDVGQGDSTLVCSDGSYMLIDTGDRDSDNTVINHLENEGVEELEYFVITHMDADHMGEAAEIVDTFEIGTIITTQMPDSLVPTTAVYENLLDSMDAKDLKFHAAADESFTLGSCEIQTYAPQGEYSSKNNYSVLVKIIHGENSFLITGDCELEEEAEFLERNVDLSADVLKAAHHGSDTSSSSEFLAAVMPSYTVISCGVDNKYGHPDEETLTRIKKYSPTVYITAEDGNITFLSDGEGLSVEESGKE